MRSLEDKIAQVTAERDKLIQISSELRAELNRQMRVVTELMQQHRLL